MLVGVMFVPRAIDATEIAPAPVITASTLFATALLIVPAPEKVNVLPKLTVNVEVVEEVAPKLNDVPVRFVLKAIDVEAVMVRAPLSVSVLAPVTAQTPAPVVLVVMDVKDLATSILRVPPFCMVIVFPAVIVLALTVFPDVIVV
ncbi:hypothetical protein WSM22_28120 [Cytophagales bacterium WSM2-2]|nr:hypothetical protein WSM22_28120 [Cytophagales bacterium WSM2-2]